MTTENTSCLYGQTENDAKNKDCNHCGMPLAKIHPNNIKNRLSSVRKVIWLIALFCLVMIIVLPR